MPPSVTSNPQSRWPLSAASGAARRGRRACKLPSWGNNSLDAKIELRSAPLDVAAEFSAMTTCLARAASVGEAQTA